MGEYAHDFTGENDGSRPRECCWSRRFNGVDLLGTISAKLAQQRPNAGGRTHLNRQKPVECSRAVRLAWMLWM
jgi:hypothetical protein